MAVALEPVPSITPLVVIAHDDPGTADSLRHAVEALAGWQAMAADPRAGELTAALAAPPPDPAAVKSVLEAARAIYRVVVMALPATDGPEVGTALSLADAMVAVGRCETAGVRGLQAALEAWTAAGHDPDTAGAVVTG